MNYQGEKELTLNIEDLKGVIQTVIVGLFWWVNEEEDKTGWELRYYTDSRWMFDNLVIKAVRNSEWTEFDEVYK